MFADNEWVIMEDFYMCLHPMFTFKHKCKNHSKASFTLVLFSAAWIMSKITLVSTRFNLLHHHAFVIVAFTLANKMLQMSVWRAQLLMWTVYSIIAAKTPASWRVTNKVEICQLFNEIAFASEYRVNVDEYFPNRSENVINLSSFCQV